MSIEPIGCLTPGCGKVARTRGLCLNCDNKARCRIAKGQTSWEELEKQGLAARPRGRRRWMKGFR